MADIDVEERDRRLSHKSNLVNLLDEKRSSSVVEFEVNQTENQDPASASIITTGEDGSIQHLPLHPVGHSGSQSIPRELKVLSGTLARTMPAAQVKEITGVNEASISVYKHGKEDTDAVSPIKQGLKDSIDNKAEAVEDKAISIVMETLGLLDPKLQEVNKATDLSVIANNIASVVNKLRKNQDSGDKSVSVKVYVPAVRDMKRFDVVEVESRITE